MTTYGDSAIGMVMISSTISGSGTSATPSGDIMYLVCTEVEGDFQSQIKITDTALGNNYSTKDGKRRNSVKLNNVYVVPYTGKATRVAAFNDFIDFLMDRVASAANPFYLFVKNSASEYVCLGRTTGGTQTSYMKGYPIGTPWKMNNKDTLMFTSITWKECQV